MPLSQPPTAASAAADAVAISIILPYYNEARTIEACVAEIRAAMGSRRDYEIVIVNDGSTDADSAMLDRLGDRVVRHRENRGYGAAVKSGIRHSAGEILVISDADGTYPGREIPRLIERLAASDMVVGDRSYHADSRRNLGPWYRRAAKELLRETANYLAATRIPDLNSGLRAFRRRDVERYLRLTPSGFSLTATLTLAYLCEGLTVEFVPIEYRPRRGDAPSNIRPIADTARILVTILRTITFFNPLRVFIPGAICLAAAGALIFVVGLVSGRMDDGTISVLLLSAVQMVVLGVVADLIARSRK